MGTDGENERKFYFLRREFSSAFYKTARMEEANEASTSSNVSIETTTRKDDGEEENVNIERLKDAADYVLKKPKEEIEEEKIKKKKKEKAAKTYTPIQIPTAEEQMQGDVMNNCVVKTALSGVMGGFLGVAMGIFFGAFEAPDHTMTQKKVSIAETLKQTARSTASKSWSYAKGFAAFGALYAGSECVVEQTRARHDIYNSAYAGCFTGGTMAARAGPKAACIGCGTMAALSVAMDHFMGLH